VVAQRGARLWNDAGIGPNRETFRVRYAGDTATFYRLLSEAGFAPEIVTITDEWIESVRYETLESWLVADVSTDERARMGEAIRDLLRAVHDTLRICHRDAHIGNVVVREGVPLLIDPAYATPSVNDHCYDLEGPGLSRVPVPDDHVNQGGWATHGVWWGSPERTRSLESVFGPHD
jgi:Phosphotransferase enzyme family